MKLVIGCDHVGFYLKEKLIDKLKADGHSIVDVGCYSTEKVDFPDISKLVCNPIISGEAQRGIIVCGSGVGAAIACNKVAGIRASVVHDVYTAHQCVEHDDVQVMAIGALIIGETIAYELTDIFLKAAFFADIPEIKRRVDKLSEMDFCKK